MRKTRLLRLAVLAALLVMALAPVPAGAQSSGIPAGATITSATFSIYADQVIAMSGDHIVHVHPVTAQWVESRVTWNSRTTGAPWSNPGGDFGPELGSFMTGAPGWYPVDVTAFVQGVVNGSVTNFGLLLRQNLDNDTRYVSSDSPSVSLRPKLEICFTTASNPVITCLTYQQGTRGNAIDAVIASNNPDQNAGNSPQLRTAFLTTLGEKRSLVQHNFQVIR